MYYLGGGSLDKYGQNTPHKQTYLEKAQYMIFDLQYHPLHVLQEMNWDWIISVLQLIGVAYGLIKYMFHVCTCT